MNFFSANMRGLAAVLVLSLTAGCVPPPGSADADQGKRFLNAGKSRTEKQDFEGARAAFEQALLSNPGLSEAHYELGALFNNETQLNVPEKALYHYIRVLELDPNFRWAELISNRLGTIRMNLTRDSTRQIFSPTLDKEIERLQRELAAATGESLRLGSENQQLKAQLAAVRPSAPSDQPLPRNVGGQPPEETPPRVPPQAPPTAVRTGYITHQFQRNDTLYSLGRRHGVTWQEILAVNPGLDARSIQPGTNIRIPVK